MKFRIEECVFVKSIGVEVECGVPRRADLEKLRRFVEEKGVRDRLIIGSDGSVWVSGCDLSSAEIKFWVEVEKWELMRQFLEILWKQVRIYQNESCGNHVHLCVPNWYQLLTFPEFIIFFETEYYNHYKKRRKYLRRLDSNYARSYLLDQQGRVVTSLHNLEVELINQYNCYGSRYRSVNFHPVHRTPSTVEFRIMPWAHDFYEHCRQIIFIVKTVETFIRNCTEVSCCEEPIGVECSVGDIEVIIPDVGDSVVEIHTLGGELL